MWAGVPKECNRHVCCQHLEVLEPTESIYWVAPTQSASSSLPCEWESSQSTGTHWPRQAHTQEHLSSAIMPGMPTALTSGWLGCKDQGFQQLCLELSLQRWTKSTPLLLWCPSVNMLLPGQCCLISICYCYKTVRMTAHVLFICANGISL